MKQAKAEEPPSEFKAFEEFTRRLLSVPKAELDRKLALERRRKTRRKRSPRK
jgi:hypothetical protein